MRLAEFPTQIRLLTVNISDPSSRCALVTALDNVQLAGRLFHLKVKFLHQRSGLERLCVVEHVAIVSSKSNDCSASWDFEACGGVRVNTRLTSRAAGRTLRCVANLSEQVALTQLEIRLSSAFEYIPADRIQSAMRSAHARFDDSRIRDFVPLLVERRVRAELANA